MHTCSFLSVCAYTHIKQSVPVRADQCVGIFHPPVSAYRHNKPDRAQRASFSIHWGHSIVLQFVKLLPPMQVFLHLIAVKYTRYVVPRASRDRVKEVCRCEDSMGLFSYCDGDGHAVTGIIKVLFHVLTATKLHHLFTIQIVIFMKVLYGSLIKVGCQSKIIFENALIVE